MLEPVDGQMGFAETLLQGLRETLGSASLDYARAPEQIPSGHETDVYALALRGGPAGCGGELILRHFRGHHAAHAASFEAAFHEGLRSQGFPAPRVVAARNEPPAFLLMERLPGRALGDGVELQEGLGARVAAMLGLLRLSVRLPDRLAETTASLLSRDPEPIVSAARARGLGAEALGFDRHLDALAEQVEGGGHLGLQAGLHWLREARPPEPERPAVCHGDLAPNLLIDEAGRVSAVIDWSSRFATLGDPAFEIANTRVMLQVPLPLPRGLQRASLAYQRALVRRYERALAARPRPSPERVRYYEAWRRFHCLLGAAEVWQACARGVPFPERPDPWSLPPVARRVAEDFQATTGVAVQLPPPPGS